MKDFQEVVHRYFKDPDRILDPAVIFVVQVFGILIAAWFLVVLIFALDK